MKRTAAGVLGLVGLMVLCPSAGASPSPGDLRDLDRKIDRHKLKLKQMDQREQHVLGQIQTISRQLETEKATIAALNRRLDYLRPSVRTTRLWIEAMDLLLERRKKYFARRLRAYYKFAAPGGAGFVAGARQADEAALRYLYLRFVLRHDKQVVAAWLAETAERRRLARYLVGLQRVVARTIKAQRLRFRRTLELSGRRYLLLRQLRRRKAAASDLVADLSLARLRLRRALARGTLGPEGRNGSPAARGGAGRTDTRMVAVARDWRPPGPSILRRRGRLPWPVEARSLITAHRLTGGVRPWRGLLLATEPGALVRCIHNGRVVFAGWFRGYGRMVIVGHGHRVYSVMAHLAEIKVKAGRDVNTGDVIGRTERSGPKGPASLYFEIRRGFKAQNTLSWMGRRARQRKDI